MIRLGSRNGTAWTMKRRRRSAPWLPHWMPWQARREAVASAVRAVVFVGDAMEEAVDDLCAKAGELGLLKVPVFMFQEGHDTVAEQAFREIARLTGGAWCRFDPGAAAQLRELLRAAAAYAAGGREALLRLSRTGSGAAQLLGQMK